MPPAMFRLSAKPLSGRYLSLAEREEIALFRVQGYTMQEVARRIGRATSTISRELRRNAATRSGGLEYRATTAQWHAERSARRPKQAKLALNAALRTHVQDRLAGVVVAPTGVPVPGPIVSWKGRRRGLRQNRRWASAWAAAVTPGPLRAFYVRVQGRKGKQVAAVATARKIAVLAWHLLTKEEDYAFARPALVAMKERQMQLKAGAKSRRGGNTPGKARDYSIKTLREKERALVEQAEKAYTRFVSAWSEKPKPDNARARNRGTKAKTE